MEQEEKEIVSWYLECKNVLEKVCALYTEYLNIRYQDSSYQELTKNYKHAHKELKKLVK